ncbi:MAG: restriction endonuclease subunit S [Candidatus Sericytochromatia bacterium]
MTIEVELGSVAKIVAGQHIESNLHNRDGDGVPYLTGPSDFTVSGPVVTKWTRYPRVFAQASDTLVTVKGAGVGKSSRGVDAAIGRQLMAIRPVESRLDPSYLYVFIRSREADIAARAQGATVPGVGKDDLASLQIPLPPVDEQRRIAAILDKADAIRQKRQEAINLVNQLLQSMFFDMFGDPLLNPKGWRKVSLDSVAVVRGGLQVTEKRSALPIEVPYLRVANVFRERLNLREVKTIRVTSSELDRTRLKKGDVLIVEGHGNPTELGRSSVWDGSIELIVHQNHLIRVEPELKQLDSVYLSYFINSAEGRRQMFGYGKTTSGLNTLSASQVKSLMILLPPIDLQRQFADLVAKSKMTTKKLEAGTRLAESLGSSLVSEMFGKLVQGPDVQIEHEFNTV